MVNLQVVDRLDLQDDILAPDVILQAVGDGQYPGDLRVGGVIGDGDVDRFEVIQGRLAAVGDAHRDRVYPRSLVQGRGPGEQPLGGDNRPRGISRVEGEGQAGGDIRIAGRGDEGQGGEGIHGLIPDGIQDRRGIDFVNRHGDCLADCCRTIADTHLEGVVCGSLGLSGGPGEIPADRVDAGPQGGSRSQGESQRVWRQIDIGGGSRERKGVQLSDNFVPDGVQCRGGIDFQHGEADILAILQGAIADADLEIVYAGTVRFVRLPGEVSAEGIEAGAIGGGHTEGEGQRVAIPVAGGGGEGYQCSFIDGLVVDVIQLWCGVVNRLRRGAGESGGGLQGAAGCRSSPAGCR